MLISCISSKCPKEDGRTNITPEVWFLIIIIATIISCLGRILVNLPGTVG
jgi:hypothetical protein